MKRQKNVLIENLINIDIAEEDKIREIKYSNRLAHADRIQLLYYLYYLKQIGIYKKGVINYPKMRKKEEIELTDEAEKEVEQALIRVKEITNLKTPPTLKKKPYCTKCAYYDFCFSGEK